MLEHDGGRSDRPQVCLKGGKWMKIPQYDL